MIPTPFPIFGLKRKTSSKTKTSGIFPTLWCLSPVTSRKIVTDRGAAASSRVMLTTFSAGTVSSRTSPPASTSSVVAGVWATTMRSPSAASAARETPRRAATAFASASERPTRSNCSGSARKAKRTPSPANLTSSMPWMTLPTTVCAGLAETPWV